MNIVIIDDQKGEADITLMLARGYGFETDKHDIKIVWRINSVTDAIKQALESDSVAIFVDYDFDNYEYPIPPGIKGSQIVRGLVSAGYKGTLFSHSGSGIKPFERDGVAQYMEPETTNKVYQRFAEIGCKLEDAQ